MALLTTTSPSARVQSRVNLARLLEMPEREFEERLRDIEATEQFRLLRASGAVVIRPYQNARLISRSFGGREWLAPGPELPELQDGHGDLARLLQRVGQEKFEQCFLRDDNLSDDERARLCGISSADARRVREMVDRLYVQAEFAGSAVRALPEGASNIVAGIQVERSRPVLGFFNRDVWKGRYTVDPSKRAALVAALPPQQVREIERLLGRIEFLERRKSTLYQMLEIFIESQAEYLVTGDLEKRRPLTQRSVAARLGVAPSVIHSLAAFKAVQLPWGLATPLKTLMPSAKSLLLGRLYDLAMEKPECSDEALGLELNRLYGARLSRRSVALYRNDLGIGGSGCRGAQV